MNTTCIAINPSINVIKADGRKEMEADAWHDAERHQENYFVPSLNMRKTVSSFLENGLNEISFKSIVVNWYFEENFKMKTIVVQLMCEKTRMTILLTYPCPSDLLPYLTRTWLKKLNVIHVHLGVISQYDSFHDILCVNRAERTMVSCATLDLGASLKAQLRDQIVEEDRIRFLALRNNDIFYYSNSNCASFRIQTRCQRRLLLGVGIRLKEGLSMAGYNKVEILDSQNNSIQEMFVEFELWKLVWEEKYIEGGLSNILCAICTHNRSPPNPSNAGAIEQFELEFCRILWFSAL